MVGCSTGNSGESHDDKDGHHSDAKSEAHGDDAENHHEDSIAGKVGKTSDVTRTVMVEMTDTMKFTPSIINVKAGETILFKIKNSGKIVHEFVIGSSDEIMEHHKLMMKFPGMEHDEPNSVSLESDASGDVIWQFTHAGSFNFACLQPGHFEAGMKGTFIVNAQ